MSRSVTLKDIARATGVHPSTVSRALDPNGRTSLTDELVERIRATAERMGYRPNRLASGLRTRRTMTAGVIIPDITNTLFPPIVRGVESVLEEHGYASIIVNSDGEEEREHKLIDVLLERGVDGIVHAAARRADPRIEEVARSGVPVVTVNRQIENSAIPSVINDDASGIDDMLHLLHEAGHRRIAHIAGPRTLSTGLQRLQAFNATMRKLGLALPAEATAVARRFDEDEGERCAEALLASGWDFTAILCANDRLALGAIDMLRRHGLACPDDVSVTGFNDIPFLDRIPPGLTTVRIMQFDVGKLSGELLVKMMADPEAVIPARTILPVKLVERGSVARVAAGVRTVHPAAG